MIQRNKEHSLWVEKHRPTTLETFVGNEHLKDKIGIYLENEDLPHLLLYGKAGTGKTTLAKILYNTIECDYLYINASDKGGVDYIRNDIIPFAGSVGFNDLKIVILDEADFLTPQSQAALRNAMETFSKTTRFILTCNYVERIIDPIQSRCQIFEVIPPSRKDTAVHVYNVLNQEEVESEKEDVALVVNSAYPDIRRIINTLQKQTVNGRLVLDKKVVVENDYKLKLLEIFKTMDKKNAFTSIRQLLADNSIRDFSDIYTFLYDMMDQYAKGHVAQVILILAEGIRDDAVVLDKEISFMATMVRLLNELK